MKTQIQKTIVVSSLFVLAGLAVMPLARAEDEKPDAATRRAQREAEMLKKYDANHDGKLDREEKAVRKADREKAKAEREAKKHDRAQPKSEGEDQ